MKHPGAHKGRTRKILCRDCDISDKMQISHGALPHDCDRHRSTKMPDGIRDVRIPQRSKKPRDMVGAPRLVNGKAGVCPPGDLHYDNRSRCPLGYKPCEHRMIESSLILSCGVHRAYSQVDIGYDYHKCHTEQWKNIFQTELAVCSGPNIKM